MTRTFWTFIYALSFMTFSDSKISGCSWSRTQESSSDNNVLDSCAGSSDAYAQRAFVHAHSSQSLNVWPMGQLDVSIRLSPGSGSDGEAHGSWLHSSAIDAEGSSDRGVANLLEGQAIVEDRHWQTNTPSSESHGTVEGSTSITAYYYPLPPPPPLPPPLVSGPPHRSRWETISTGVTALAASHDSFYETGKMDMRGCRKRERLRRQSPSDQLSSTIASATQVTVDATVASSPAAFPSVSAPASDSTTESVITTVMSLTSSPLSNDRTQISSVSSPVSPISASPATSLAAPTIFTSTISTPLVSFSSPLSVTSMESTSTFSTASTESLTTSSSSASSESSSQSTDLSTTSTSSLTTSQDGSTSSSLSTSSSSSSTISSGSISSISSTSSSVPHSSSSAASSSTSSLSSTFSQSPSSSLSSSSIFSSSFPPSTATTPTTTAPTSFSSSSSSFSSSSIMSLPLSPPATSSTPDESSMDFTDTIVFTATMTVTPSRTIFMSYTSTFTTTQFSTLTLPNGQTSRTPTNTETVVTSGVLSTQPPNTPGNAFARNKGAIIGVSIGGVVALIAGVFVVFFFCGRWRRRNAAMAGDNVMKEMGPTTRTGRLAATLGLAGMGKPGLARDGSGSASSRQVLNRNYSSTSTSWRPPLSGEDDGDDEFSAGHLSGVLQSPHSTGYAMGVGSRIEDGGAHSVSGDDHGSSNGHGTGVIGPSSNMEHTANISRSGSVAQMQMQQQQAFTFNKMPGFGQAAESMTGLAGSSMSSPIPPPSPSSQINRHSSGPGPDPGLWYATGRVGDEPASVLPTSPASVVTASSLHGHSSTSGHNDTQCLSRSGSSLTQPITSTTPVETSSSNSHSNSDTHIGIMLPRVKISKATPPSSFREDRDPKQKRRLSDTRSLKGFVERLRGGRSSTQGSPDTIPASSSFYPPESFAAGGSPAPSSLLNPPLPPNLVRPKIPLADLGSGAAPWNEESTEGFASVEGITRMWPQPMPPPFPSPAITEDSEVLPEGLLNPDLALPQTRSQIGFTPRPSLGSLRDHVDYSRPFSGLVFNRMDSSTSFATTTTTDGAYHTTHGIETSNGDGQTRPD